MPGMSSAKWMSAKCPRWKWPDRPAEHKVDFMADPGKREAGKATFKQDALEAWDDYQVTGHHATADEVEQWLASWGSDGEAPAPPCHL